MSPSRSPLLLTPRHSSTFLPLIRTLNQENNPKNKNLRNQPCIALTNAAEVITRKPSKVRIPFEATPHEPSQQPHELKKVSHETLQYESGFLGAVPDKLMAGDGREGNNIHDAMSYLTKILTSKVYDVAIESPLDYAPKLSERFGVNLWLKREDLQPVRFFS